MRVTVRVHPQAQQERIEPRDGGSLEVWVKAPPVEGRANSDVCRVVAAASGVPASSVRIVAGWRSRTKLVEIHQAGEELTGRRSG